MAKVTWSAGIDHVSGALSKPGKNGQHSCAKMLLATHRVAATESKDCNRLYLRPKPTRSTQPSNDELAARSRFATLSAQVKARMRDLEHIQEDQANFLAQKDTAAGRKTMRAYLWKLLGDIYDRQNG